MALEVGDFVTVDHWIGRKDGSYTRDVLEVLCISGKLVRVFLHDRYEHNSDQMTLNTDQVVFAQLCNKFVDMVLCDNCKAQDKCKTTCACDCDRTTCPHVPRPVDDRPRKPIPRMTRHNCRRSCGSRCSNCC